MLRRQPLQSLHPSTRVSLAEQSSIPRSPCTCSSLSSREQRIKIQWIESRIRSLVFFSSVIRIVGIERVSPSATRKIVVSMRMQPPFTSRTLYILPHAPLTHSFSKHTYRNLSVRHHSLSWAARSVVVYDVTSQGVSFVSEMDSYVLAKCINHLIRIFLCGRHVPRAILLEELFWRFVYVTGGFVGL